MRSPRPQNIGELEATRRSLDRREADLQAREERERLIGELGSFFSYVIDVDANGRMQFPGKPGPTDPLEGFSIDGVLLSDWGSFVHPDDSSYVWKLLLQALHEGRATGEYRLKDNKGELRWVKNSIRRIRDESSDRVQLFGVVGDITDLRRTKQALHESEVSFERLFRAAPVVMTISSLEDGRFIDVNDRFSEMTGFSREEAIDKTATELGLWESTAQRDQVREIRRDQEGAFEGLEIQMRTKAGERLVALVSAEVVALSGRKCAVWHAVDITERKRIEGELREHRENLELLVEARTSELERSRHQLRHSERLASLGTLAAGIAHQINNPLGVILAATQHALDCEGDADVADVWRKALKESERHAQRCARIVRSILQFSRDEPSQKWEEDLRGAVRRACNLTRSYAHDRAAQLSAEVGEEAIPVSMNPVEMEQLLVNILRNAIESKQRGAKVVASVRAEGTRAIVSVQDDGPGIPEDALAHVFDPFFTSRLDEAGTGLGLSVAHGIVADHQGTISIESPDSGGCTVRIEFPISGS